MKKILFPITSKLDNVNYASGSTYSIYVHLKKYFDVIPVGPLQSHRSFIRMGLNILYHKGILPHQFSTSHTWKRVNSYSSQLQKYIDQYQFDAIFATSTLFAAKVHTTKPIFAYTDFSFYNALNYYSSASNLWSSSQKQALDVDKFCFKKLDKVFLASEWAKMETTKAYNLENDKIIAIGRGANLESGFDEHLLENIINFRNDQQLKKFLFVGIDWGRKGGDIAFNIVGKLRSLGYNVILQVVGCNPPSEITKHTYVEIFPFLSRTKPNELNDLINLFTNAWCFILPTKAEAMGIVFAEAASFGLPSIALRTGGVGAAVEDQKTGLLFEVSSHLDDMVEKTKDILENESIYRSLSMNAFFKYKNDLNWERIACRITDTICNFM